MAELLESKQPCKARYFANDAKVLVSPFYDGLIHLFQHDYTW